MPHLPSRTIAGLSVLILCLVNASSAVRGQDADDVARQLVDDYENRIRPIEVEVNRRWWDANVTGADDAYQRKQEAENRLDEALADRTRFARLKACDGKVKDQLLARQIRLLYLQALPKQVDAELLKQIVTRANAVEMRFNVYRAKVAGKELTDSEVRRILHDSRDSDERRAAWEASKGVGREVAQELRTLVQLRNKSARELGFDDFYAMQFTLNEQKSDDVLAMFDELDQLTRQPFEEAKQDIDRRLAERYKIATAQLEPWHYHDPFFQEPPAVYETSLDAAYTGVDIPELCRKFYRGIGLPIDEVLKRSDLYEKRGKNPHAFCTDIDRQGDVRVLANIVKKEYWMGTMLHELGHSVYSSRYIPKSLPYVVRTDAHILATEGLAMMFERFSKSADWLTAMGVDVTDAAAFNSTGRLMRRNKLLIFSRWCQVMLRFEKELYRDPDQDLNGVWWSLVERYQQVKRPEGRDEPDYASKIHIVVAPCYYHNYMLGELFACQLHQAIAKKLFPDRDPRTLIYVNQPKVGEFLQKHVFDPGRTLTWNELTRFATGASLQPRAFAADLEE